MKSTEFPKLMASAASAGAIYGIFEPLSTCVEGRLWLPLPFSLFLASVGLGALLTLIPGAILGRTLLHGKALLGAAIFLAAAELGLAYVTDPPPFQEPPWWMGNLWMTLAGFGVLAAIAWGHQRLPHAGAALLGALCLFPLLQSLQARDGADRDPSQGPNLLFITSDTTRADYTSPYGHPTVQTPHLARLAEEGVLFEQAYAQIAVTGPSHTTLFSGAGTWSHNTLLNGIPAPADRPLLAEALQEQGYHTAAFVSAYVLEDAIGLSRGFSIYDDDFSTLRGGSELLGMRLLALLKRHFAPDEVLERRGGDTTDLALSWLSQLPEDQAWMLWVHLFDPHGPYEPPPPYDTLYYEGDPSDPANDSMKDVKNVAAYLKESLEGVRDLEWVLAQYAGEISYMDSQVGRLLSALDQRGETDNTLVVFTGDHGESLGENDVWFNHGDDVYDPSLQVPLLLRWPDKIPSSERVDGIVELTDITPTIYDLFELEALEGADGQSLRPLWSGSGESRPFARSLIFDREANVAEREAGRSTQPTWRMAGLRGGDNLFVHRDAADFFDAWYWDEAQVEDSLPGFIEAAGAALPEDHTEEAWELREAAREKIALKNALLEMAEGLMLAGAEGVERSGQEISEEQRRRLEALGYME